jgi:hypothetical protein
MQDLHLRLSNALTRMVGWTTTSFDDGVRLIADETVINAHPYFAEKVIRYKSTFMNRFTENAQVFIIAHELGHMLAEAPDSPGYSGSQIDFGAVIPNYANLNVVQKKEISADLIGTVLAEQAGCDGYSAGQEIFRVLTQAANTHPPSADRLTVLQQVRALSSPVRQSIMQWLNGLK